MYRCALIVSHVSLRPSSSIMVGDGGRENKQTSCICFIFCVRFEVEDVCSTVVFVAIIIEVGVMCGIRVVI